MVALADDCRTLNRDLGRIVALADDCPTLDHHLGRIVATADDCRALGRDLARVVAVPHDRRAPAAPGRAGPPLDLRPTFRYALPALLFRQPLLTAQ